MPNSFSHVHKKEVPPLARGLKPPQHIAIVMDGNGRWAQAHNLPIEKGHKAGAEALRHLLKAIEVWNIKYLTVFAFSTENWKREEKEVNALMSLMAHYLGTCLDDLLLNKIRLKVVGDLSKFDNFLQEKIKEVIEKTEKNYKATLVIGLNYGARQEILMAAGKLAKKVEKENLDLSCVTEEEFSSLLYTKGIPDPDLFIRSGGEYRLSNFLLWQSSYAELFFTETLWPDFTYDNLLDAIKSYNQRERRYGKRLV